MKTPFISKRNNVYLEDGIVVKIFSSQKNYLQEKAANIELRNCGLSLPSIIEYRNEDNSGKAEEKTLYYEYIDGDVYAEIVEELTEEQIKELILWISEFNKVMGVHHPDLNLRNFIYNIKKGCVGVDFEGVDGKVLELSRAERHENGNALRIEKDIGKILAFVSTYDVAFNSKKEYTAREILRNVNALFPEVNFDVVKNEYKSEIEDMLLRRNSKSFCLVDAMDFFEKLYCPCSYNV